MLQLCCLSSSIFISRSLNPLTETMSDTLDSPPPLGNAEVVEGSPKIDKKVKNFSARLKARAKAEAAKNENVGQRPSSVIFRPESSASTTRPDSVLSFRSELPTVTTYRHLSLASDVSLWVMYSNITTTLCHISHIWFLNSVKYYCVSKTKPSDFGVFRPESASILPPETVTTMRPGSVAGVKSQSQAVFRPFQAPSGPTAR